MHDTDDPIATTTPADSGIILPSPAPGTAFSLTAHSPLFGANVVVDVTTNGVDDDPFPRNLRVWAQPDSPAALRGMIARLFDASPTGVSVDADRLARVTADAEARADLLERTAAAVSAAALASGGVANDALPLPARVHEVLRIAVARAAETARGSTTTDAEERTRLARVAADGAARAAAAEASVAELTEKLDVLRSREDAAVARCLEWQGECAALQGRIAEAVGARETANAEVARLHKVNAELLAQVKAWESTAAERDRSAAYYRGLVVTIGEAVGDAAYIAEDGSRQQDVLCAKVPELVVPILRAAEKAAVGHAQTFDDLRAAAEAADGRAAAAESEVSELRATLAEVRNALGGAPGTPDQLLGAAVAKARTEALAAGRAVTETLTRPEGDTFHAGAVATRGAAADLAYRLSESNADDIARAIIRMDLPRPSSAPPAEVPAEVCPAPTLPPPSVEAVPVVRADGVVIGAVPAVAPAEPPTTASEAPAATPEVESVGPAAAADTPARYNVAAASKGLSPWETAPAEPPVSKGVRTAPPAPPVPVDAPPPPAAVPLTPEEEALVGRIAEAKFLKDIILATVAAFPAWDAAACVAFYGRVRDRVVMLRRIPEVTLPDRVSTHLKLLAG